MGALGIRERRRSRPGTRSEQRFNRLFIFGPVLKSGYVGSLLTRLEIKKGCFFGSVAKPNASAIFFLIQISVAIASPPKFQRCGIYIALPCGLNRS